MTDRTITELEMVVVHSDENLSVMYNPATHEITSEEAAGNIILSIRRRADMPFDVASLPNSAT